MFKNNIAEYTSAVEKITEWKLFLLWETNLIFYSFVLKTILLCTGLSTCNYRKTRGPLFWMVFYPLCNKMFKIVTWLNLFCRQYDIIRVAIFWWSCVGKTLKIDVILKLFLFTYFKNNFGDSHLKSLAIK